MIKRALKPVVREGAQQFPVVAILGPRQSGKTTLAKMAFAQHAYVTLEDLDLRTAAKKDPRTFIIANKNKHGLIIDEFQYVPELLSYIKTMVDEDQTPGTFILTGSQNFLMNQAISQSLAGRISIHTLLPLSIAELKEDALLPTEIEPMLYQGCYPATYAKNVTPKNLYRNYLTTYIERDVHQLTHVGDLTTFQTFITLCAARVGQLLNITSLGNECGISDNTAKRWLSILEASYIIFLLRPYHANFGKRLVKTPKLYFYDAGLACFLLKIKQEELGLHPNRGNLFESFIISDLFKAYYNRSELPRLYFWRDKSEHEVDCIIDEGRKIFALEIKAGRTTSPRFFEGLEQWHQLAPKKTTASYVIFAGSSRQTRSTTQLVSWQLLDNIEREFFK
jgi:predicted AAA+ superfamily ATPase